jgi:hypothetical protein
MAPALERTTSSASKHKKNRKQGPTTPAERPQHSISHLLKSHESKRVPEDHNDTSTFSPESKRRKLSSEATPLAPAQQVSKVNMYSFPTRHAIGSTVVDLTKSPTTSPSQRTRRLSVTSRVDTSNTNGAPKRLMVKNLRTTPRSDPSQYLDKTFKSLEDALTAIFNNQQPALSNEELYRGSENLCKLGKAKELWKMLQDRCKKHVFHDLSVPLVERAGSDSVDLLKDVLEAWSTWNKQLVSDVCTHAVCYTDVVDSLPFVPSSSTSIVPIYYNVESQ